MSAEHDEQETSEQERLDRVCEQIARLLDADPHDLSLVINEKYVLLTLDEAERLLTAVDPPQKSRWTDETLPTEVVGSCCRTEDDVVRAYNILDGKDHHCNRCGRSAPISWTVVGGG